MPRMESYANGVPCWVDLAATDVDAARSFYSGLFGWEWNGGEMPQGGTYWGAQLGGAGVAAAYTQPEQHAEQGLPSIWYTYIAVDDVDASAAAAEAAGGTVVMGPADVPGAGRMAFFTDPSGAALGMWQGGEHKGAGLVKEHGSLVWSEVYAPDTAATVAFYGELFGWTAGSMEIPGGGTYTTFELNGETVGGTMPPPRDDVPPHWHVWFASDDTDATAARAVELGATVVVDPTDSPYGKMGSFVDPVGAVFSVITPSSD